MARERLPVQGRQTTADTRSWMVASAESPVEAKVPAKDRLWWAPPLGLGLALYLVLALALAYTKAPWCDEGWFANPAYNLAFRGNIGSNLIEPSGFFLNAYMRGVQQHTYYIMPGNIVALAGWFEVFGMGLFSARLYSIAWGLVTLCVFFYILERLFPDRRVAILGTLLAAVDFIFVWLTADVRMEAPANALALGSFAAYLYFRQKDFREQDFREKDLRRAVLWTQALGALAIFIHPNAALVVLAVAVLALRDNWERLRRHPWRYLALAAAPYVVVAIVWSFYIWQAPADFKAQFLANAAGHNSERLTRLIRPDIAIGLEIVRYLTAYYLSGVWSAAMPGWGILIPLLYIPPTVWFLRMRRRHEPGVRTFLLYFVVMVLAMTFLNGFKVRNYLLYLMPLYDAILAAWLVSLWRRGVGARCVATAFATVFVALQLGVSILHIHDDERHRYYDAAVADLEQYRAQGKSIAGTAAFGFGLRFQGFTDDARLAMYSGKPLPDIFVIDRAYRNFAHSFGMDEPAVFAHLATTLSTRYRFVAEHGPFWIFERTEPGPPWIETRDLMSVDNEKRAIVFFHRMFVVCKMQDLSESAL